MSTTTTTPINAGPSAVPVAMAPAPPAPERYRFTSDQYKKMGEAGILTEEDRVELVEGVVYLRPLKKGPHSIACRETTTSLTRVVPVDQYFVTREDPVEIPGRAGMPEPDISVVRGRSRDYLQQPDASRVPMIVEVADKTRLAFDQGDKQFSYAGGGIPVYWIVNLVDRQVEVYTEPGPEGYRSRRVYQSGERVPVVIDGVTVGEVAVDDLLP